MPAFAVCRCWAVARSYYQRSTSRQPPLAAGLLMQHVAAASTGLTASASSWHCLHASRTQACHVVSQHTQRRLRLADMYVNLTSGCNVMAVPYKHACSANCSDPSLQPQQNYSSAGSALLRAWCRLSQAPAAQVLSKFEETSLTLLGNQLGLQRRRRLASALRWRVLLLPCVQRRGLRQVLVVAPVRGVQLVVAPFAQELRQQTRLIFQSENELF